MNNVKVVSAKQAKIAYKLKITYAAQQQAVRGQGSLWIKIKIGCLYTMAKVTTIYQAYRLLTTFYRILHFLIQLQKSLQYNMYYYCHVLYSGKF
jgi:hypothetical protein